MDETGARRTTRPRNARVRPGTRPPTVTHTPARGGRIPHGRLLLALPLVLTAALPLLAGAPEAGAAPWASLRLPPPLSTDFGNTYTTTPNDVIDATPGVRQARRLGRARYEDGHGTTAEAGGTTTAAELVVCGDTGAEGDDCVRHDGSATALAATGAIASFTKAAAGVPSDGRNLAGPRTADSPITALRLARMLYPQAYGALAAAGERAIPAEVRPSIPPLRLPAEDPTEARAIRRAVLMSGATAAAIALIAWCATAISRGRSRTRRPAPVRSSRTTMDVQSGGAPDLASRLRHSQVTAPDRDTNTPDGHRGSPNSQDERTRLSASGTLPRAEARHAGSRAAGRDSQDGR